MQSPVRVAGVLGRALCRAARTPKCLPSHHARCSTARASASATIIHALPPSGFNRYPFYQQSHRSLSTLPLSQPLPPSSTSTLPVAVDASSASTSPAALPSQPTSAHSSINPHSPCPPQPSFWVPFLTLLSLFPILFAVDDAIVTLATVHGRSMQPTLNPHLPPAATSPSSSSSSSSSASSSLDVVLIWKLSSFSPSSLPHGSLLVLKSPHTPTRFLIKRLIGREGDWIATRQRAGADVDDAERVGAEFGHIELIGKGRMWVEGENEVASVEDSREYGQMPAALVQGRVVAVVWPPSRMRWIGNTLLHVGGETRLRNRILAW